MLWDYRVVRGTRKAVENIEKVIGARLKARRKAVGKSQERVAEDAGCATSTIQRIEGGELNVTLQTLFGYCQAVDWSIMALFSPTEVVVKPTVEQALEVLSDLAKWVRRVPPDLLPDLSSASEVDLDSVRDILKAGRASRELAKGNTQKKSKKGVG